MAFASEASRDDGDDWLALSASLPEIELERDAVGIPKIERHREALIVDRVMLDAELVEARLPGLELRPVGHGEGEVIETHALRRESAACDDVVLREREHR